MQYKIVGFVGVNKSKSSTLNYIMDVLKLVKNVIDIDLKIYTQFSHKIEMCAGCCQCFNSHKCHLDQVDCMAEIKKQLLEADFVIMGSPVYMHSITGSMKNFLDRLSYWSHILALRGKNAMVVSSADSNGGNLTTNYLKKVLSYFGCPVVTTANIFSIKDYDDELKVTHADKIIECLREPVKSTDMIETIYQTMNVVMNYRVALTGDVEYEYWKKHGLLNANSFSDLI